MPLKRRTEPAAAALLLLAASLAAFCPACSHSGTGSQQTQQKAAPALPDDVQSAAMAPFGPAGEALDYGDFSAAGGRQVLVVHRLTSTAPPGSAAPVAPQKPETTMDVIRVSILSREGNKWMEAFRADGHLKNRRGYLDGSPSAVSSWRMSYEKTSDSGFRLEFTALNLPPGAKPVNVRVAWNPKQQEYDSLDASGTQFLRPLSTPGGVPLRVER